jgi:ubiquinone/menaquinone biosynthesis C-methylase UbiE
MWDKGWDKLFSQVEWGRYPGEELIRFVARNFYSVPNRKDIHILEIGCGTGANLWFLAREGFTVYGVDGSNIALDHAAKYLKNENLAADLHQGDVMKLPYSDSTFHAVLDVECVYANTLSDAAAILDEVYRVLKPGGWIYSKAFSTGMSGENTGLRMDGEPNTFVAMPDGPLHKEYGIIRLTSEEEIPKIFQQFKDIEYDLITRTDKNRSLNLSEWIIQGRK